MFDLMHKNYENQIQISWRSQKRNLDIYNAQFLSRYGFVVQRVKDREVEVLEAVDARAQEIGKFIDKIDLQMLIDFLNRKSKCGMSRDCQIFTEQFNRLCGIKF